MSSQEDEITYAQAQLIRDRLGQVSHHWPNANPDWPKIRDQIHSLNKKQASEVIHHLTSLKIRQESMSAEEFSDYLKENFNN